MHKMINPPLYDTDVGVTIKCTLKLGDFDAAGASVQLHVANDPPRDMSFDNVDLATYTTVADDFEPGQHLAQVRLTKGAVTLNSEIFKIPVLGSV
jgi:hypothetical protein